MAPRYSLAPERRYPTPARQLMQIFPFLDANGARLGLDPGRVVVAGPHSELLVERLRALGAEPETVFFPADHAPPLGHEYQFDPGSDAGRLFLERMLAFIRRRLAPVV